MVNGHVYLKYSQVFLQQGFCFWWPPGCLKYADSICLKLNFSVVPNPWIGTVYTVSHLESWKSFFYIHISFPVSYQVLKIPSHHSFLPQFCHILDPHHSSFGQFQGSSKIPCLQPHCSLLGLHNTVRTIFPQDEWNSCFMARHIRPPCHLSCLGPVTFIFLMFKNTEQVAFH